MPGVYDLLPRPTVACSSEIGQLWQTPRRGVRGTPPACGDYPVRVALAEQPDGSRAWVGMLLRDLLPEMIISAPMGTGKTHLAKLLLSEVLRVGAGASVTDFKADLVSDILAGMIPRA